MQSQVDVIIGTPICRRTAYILDKLLLNQQEIQKLIQTSIFTRCNIARKLQTIAHRGTDSFKEQATQYRERH